VGRASATTLATAIADHLDTTRVVHVDDLVPVEAEQGPSFLKTTPDVWSRPPTWLRDQLVGWTSQLHPHIHR
jgi:hypothetical protein